MTRTKYKNKCCGNCEHFNLVWVEMLSNATVTDYHICDYQEQRLIEGVYEPNDYDCYKPATKLHMNELKKTALEIIERITEV